MSSLHIPAGDPIRWPSLGGPICDFIEDLLVHGPGDLLGEPIVLSNEMAAFIWRAYEVYPRDHHLAGRRRFKRAVLSRRKGWSKTELAAWIAICEMDPSAPVRCDGWRQEGKKWVPVGRPVRDPYIPMLATTEEQADDLAYGAVYAILTNEACGLVNEYDCGLERIAHGTAPGKMVALAGAPSARDGARTTFQHFDETHLFTSPRLKDSHKTMMGNLPKRRGSDPWGLETTTSYGPGEDSVAEGAHRYAEDVRRGRITDSTLLYDHLQASEGHDLTTKRGLRAAIQEASGDAWAFTDLEGIEALRADPVYGENRWRRYWLNQKRKTSAMFLPPGLWEALANPKRSVAADTPVVVAFDGSYARDSTVLIGATVEEKPHIFEIDAWEKSASDGPGWRVPVLAVKTAVERAMQTFRVLEFCPDPPGWRSELEEWEATYGETVVRFETNKPSLMGPAIDEFEQAVGDKALTHDGSEMIARHLGNAVPDKSRGYPRIRKSEDDSPDKIDGAVGAVIAHTRAKWRHMNHVEAEVLVAWA